MVAWKILVLLRFQIEKPFSVRWAKEFLKPPLLINVEKRKDREGSKQSSAIHVARLGQTCDGNTCDSRWQGIPPPTHSCLSHRRSVIVPNSQQWNLHYTLQAHMLYPFSEFNKHSFSMEKKMSNLTCLFQGPQQHSTEHEKKETVPPLLKRPHLRWDIGSKCSLVHDAMSQLPLHR